MGFDFSTNENKLHLNLSNFAISTIEQDMTLFGINTKSGFINTIITNYQEDSLATISIAANLYKEKLYSQLEHIKSDSIIKENIISSLTSSYIKELQSKFSSYEKGIGFKIRINNKNSDYLESDCNEDSYYKSAGKYVKALIEDYCSLPFSERERIIYKDIIDIINQAINEKKILSLRILSFDKESIQIKPFSIITDPQTGYLFLVGLNHKNNVFNNNSEIFSYRITGLKKDSIKKLSAPSFISSEKRKYILSSLDKKSVAFMYDDLSEYVIELTKNGEDMYNRIHHLRPAYSNRSFIEDRKIYQYTFISTAHQIEFYFFKFGKDAVIISPLELKEKFHNMYTKAEKKYR